MDANAVREQTLEMAALLRTLADETTRPNCSRAVCEAYAGRLMKEAARLYAATLFTPAVSKPTPAPLPSDYQLDN